MTWLNPGLNGIAKLLSISEIEHGGNFMLKFEMADVEEMPYLYEERSCSMDPAAVGKAMGEAFQSVMGALRRKQVTPGVVLSAYYTYDPDKMTLRAGFSVSPEDASKADGALKAAILPAGRVLTFTHMGPYSELRDSYGKMMEYMEANGMKPGIPTWEIYVNDPATTPPDKLETKVFVSLAETGKSEAG